jgi:DNA-binding transcriptional ArsR family regulator
MVEHRPERLDGVFGAIADHTRRAILQQLGRGPLRVTDIAKNYPVSLNAISKHLIVLQRAGLVSQEIRGRDRFCSLSGKPLREASAWIDKMSSFWENKLDALEGRIAAKRRAKPGEPNK